MNCPYETLRPQHVIGRFATLDRPLGFTGHDKRAPPKFRRDLLVRSVFSEGPACRVRIAMVEG